jgi:hypothetical protein
MRELIERFSQEDVEPVASALLDATEQRRTDGSCHLKWPDTVYDYDSGVRIDPIITGLKEERQEFAPLFARFHDEVFLGAKYDTSSIYVGADRLSRQQMEDLVLSRAIRPTTSASTLLNYSMYKRLKHGKLLTNDIARPLDVKYAFNMNPEEFYGLVTAPEGAVALNSLYAPWDKLVENLEQEEELSVEDKLAYVTHLQDIQMVGVANLIAMLHPKTNAHGSEDLLRLMNAAYSLDNPDDPFSDRAFEDPIVQHETEFDWRIIRRAIRLFNKEENFSEAICQGDQQFGMPAASEAAGVENDNRRTFIQLLKDRQPEFLQYLTPGPEVETASTHEAFAMGIRAAAKAIKLQTVQLHDKRPAFEMSDVPQEELVALYAPEIHFMLRKWVEPVERGIESSKQIIPTDFEQLPQAVQNTYEQWARSLIGLFPVDYDVSLKAVAERLHTTAGLDLYNDYFAAGGNTPSSLCGSLSTPDYAELNDGMKTYCQKISYELLVLLPSEHQQA